MPGAWPLLGTVKKAVAHYYSGDDVSFPPRGCPVLEVACFSEQIGEKDVGFFERENNDVLFLAFVMKLYEVREDAVKFAKMKEARQSVQMRVKYRPSAAKRLIHNYQLKENEETNADLFGAQRVPTCSRAGITPRPTYVLEFRPKTTTPARSSRDLVALPPDPWFNAPPDG